MLGQIITERIRKEGPISFCDYMDMALYYPQFGYYTSPKQKIGTRGDFYTGPSLSPVFGDLVAKQIEQMWDIVNEKEFTVVEFGAGPGNLCRSILYHFKNSERYEQLRYCIIEKSPYMIAEAKTILPENVQWIHSLDELNAVTGCVLSNELVDNLSVHRVVMRNGLQEIFVDHQNKFREVLIPARGQLHKYLDDLKINLPEGHCAEINLQATQWMNEVAIKLKKGFVITIDYGYPAGELLDENRKKGTLTCYYKHRINEDPYRFIGDQDITAHVNFSALCLAGHRAGLDYCGFTDQCNFLLALGFYEWIKEKAIPGNDYQNFFHEQTLTRILLYEMGHKFKVLIQKKGIDDATLTGLRRH